MSPELTLVLVGIGLYLVDSIRLLPPSDGVFLVSGQVWRASLGFEQMQFSGKHLALLSPVAPGHPAFQFTWYDETVVNSPAIAELLRARASKLRFLSIPVTLQLVVMFVVVPFCLFRFPGAPLASAVGILYVNAFVALCMVAFRRERLDLHWARFAAIALECLICIPLSINLLRKLSLNFEPVKNMISVAPSLLSDEKYREAAIALGKRIATALEVEEVGTNGYLELVRLRESIRLGTS